MFNVVAYFNSLANPVTKSILAVHCHDNCVLELVTIRIDVPHEELQCRKSSRDEPSKATKVVVNQPLPVEKSTKKRFMNLYFASNKNDRSCARFRKVSVKTDDIKDIFGEEIFSI